MIATQVFIVRGEQRCPDLSYDVAACRNVFPDFVVFFTQLNLYEGARLWLGKEEPYIFTPVKRQIIRAMSRNGVQLIGSNS